MGACMLPNRGQRGKRLRVPSCAPACVAPQPLPWHQFDDFKRAAVSQPHAVQQLVSLLAGGEEAGGTPDHWQMVVVRAALHLPLSAPRHRPARGSDLERSTLPHLTALELNSSVFAPSHPRTQTLFPNPPLSNRST